MTLLSVSNFTYTGVEGRTGLYHIHPEQKTLLVENGHHPVLPANPPSLVESSGKKGSLTTFQTF